MKQAPPGSFVRYLVKRGAKGRKQTSGAWEQDDDGNVKD